MKPYQIDIRPWLKIFQKPLAFLLLLSAVSLACFGQEQDPFAELGDGTTNPAPTNSPADTPSPTNAALPLPTETAESPTETAEPITGEGDLETFCALYNELINDAARRFEEIDANPADPANQQRYEEAEMAFEDFFDQMVEPAPPEIRPTVQALADMSLMGLFSSVEGLPEAERMIQSVADFALNNCEISLGG